MSDVRDYSQSGEQAHLLELAATLPRGRFLDIGAGDGETFSNTRALALAGWPGVLVEPAAWAFDRLALLYGHNSDYDLVQAVITPDEMGLVPWHYTHGDHLSTTDLREVAKWRQVPFQRAYAASAGLRRLLTAVTQYGKDPISVVSIDAEGLTHELVKAYAAEPYHWPHVQVICYEHENFASAGKVALTGDFELVVRTANNAIYRRRP